jgi:DDE superfamily endonuclease
MEDVLEVYTWPDRDDIRIVCMDEISTQLLLDTREAIPAQSSHPKRQDHEYERNGTANIFIGFEPLRSVRFTEVTEQRTRVDWAHWVKTLLDVRYPDADLIVLVMDNLNIHSIASLYEAYSPAEAKRLAMKLEIHYTPKHGSWLNMAEIEASVLRRQCLNDRRIPDRTILARELRAWERRRNRHKTTVDWRFTVDDARIRLKRLYPSIED